MKYLTEEQTKWQGLETYTKAKELLNKKAYTVLWRDKYSKRKSVGPCQDIARKSDSNSYKDFFEFYLTHATDNMSLPISKRGCTIDELENVAHNWMTDSGNPDSLSIDTFFYGVVMHVVIETMMGKIKENEVKEAFTKCGYEIKDSTSDEDAEMGIDFKAYKDGSLSWLIQVKPISFILGFKPDLINDRKYVFAKHSLGTSKYPTARYAYFFYNSKDAGKWIYNCDKNSYFFFYEEIVSPTGYPLVKKEDLLKCQKNKIELNDGQNG